MAILSRQGKKTSATKTHSELGQITNGFEGRGPAHPWPRRSDVSKGSYRSYGLILQLTPCDSAVTGGRRGGGGGHNKEAMC